MTDLHKTFRISSWSSTNIIYDVKDDPILQVSVQKPSTSSKPQCDQKLTLSRSLSELSLLSQYDHHTYILDLRGCWYFIWTGHELGIGRGIFESGRANRGFNNIISKGSGMNWGFGQGNFEGARRGKPPIKNPQRPPSLKFRPDLNHVGSSSNIQDIFLIIQWHDSWFQRWPHPPNLQSGTLNVL